jgi:phosphatidylserine/phosphatidylglycerophosphate/cardiolipin synthase-like enzyme
MKGESMLYTHPQVRDLLVERAQDWNAFIERQVERVNTPPASPHLNEQYYKEGTTFPEWRVQYQYEGGPGYV